MRTQANAGFSMIEVMVSMGVMMIGILGLSSSMIGSLNLNSVNRQTALATAAARTVMENMRSEAFADVFKRYNATTTDDVGTVPGNAFDVEGLTAQLGDVDGRVGEIIFPTPANGPGVLTEVAGNGFPRLSRDLNLDGDAIDGNVTTTYRLLPVIIRVRWRSAGGNQTAQFVSMMRG